LDLLLVHASHRDEVVPQSLYARNFFGDQFLGGLTDLLYQVEC
jgi:hypothetical protein